MTYTVTDARRPLSVDIGQRQRRYLFSMGLRTACLLIAVFAPLPLVLRVVTIAAAVALPYFAVVFANSGRETEETAEFTLNPTVDRNRRQINGNQRQIGS